MNAKTFTKIKAISNFSLAILLFMTVVFAYVYENHYVNRYAQTLPAEERSAFAMGAMVVFVFGTVVFGAILFASGILSLISGIRLFKSLSKDEVPQSAFIVGRVSKAVSAVGLVLLFISAFSNLSKGIFMTLAAVFLLSFILDFLFVKKALKNA